MYDTLIAPFNQFVETLRSPESRSVYVVNPEQEKALREHSKWAEAHAKGCLINIRTTADVLTHVTDQVNPFDGKRVSELGFLFKALSESVEAFSDMKDEADHILENIKEVKS